MEDIKISTISPCMFGNDTIVHADGSSVSYQLSMVPQSCSNRQTSKIKEKYKDKEVQKADNKDTKILAICLLGWYNIDVTEMELKR